MGRRKLSQLVIGVMLVILLMAGCGVPATTPIPEPPTATQIPTDTPQPTATSTPTPTPTTGQVKGALVDKSAGQAVVARVNLIPGEVGDDGSFAYSVELLKERMMSMDAASGVFLFENVKPGYYTVTVNIGGGMPIDVIDDQGAFIIIQVEAGQVVDLGEILVKK